LVTIDRHAEEGLFVATPVSMEAIDVASARPAC
jgi:hypothetical protein